MPVWRLLATLALACSIATPGSAEDGGVVEFQGRHYHVPLQADQLADPDYVQRFGTAMEIELSTVFWNSLYRKPAAATGWQLNPREMPLRLTLPDDIYVWSSGQPAGHPPMPQTLRSDGVQHGVPVWEDTTSLAASGRLLLTYAGRTDFYVVCDRRQLWNQQDSCDLVWKDAGVLAVFPIYGNLVATAPGVVNAFVAAIRPSGVIGSVVSGRAAGPA
ncbi:hypothetical protein MMC34_008133 [Xylographa carneopallida]|nr:hypothetical protein [Xylographa carneopallida]